MIRLLIVDDSRVLRSFLSRILQAVEGIEVVGECANGFEVTSRAEGAIPDVVLMDMSMPVMNGVQATRLIQQNHPAVRIIMLSGSRTAQDLRDAAAAGAVGYLLKDGNIGAMVAAIRTVARGGTAWPV